MDTAPTAWEAPLATTSGGAVDDELAVDDVCALVGMTPALVGATTVLVGVTTALAAGLVASTWALVGALVAADELRAREDAAGAEVAGADVASAEVDGAEVAGALVAGVEVAAADPVDGLPADVAALPGDDALTADGDVALANGCVDVPVAADDDAAVGVVAAVVTGVEVPEAAARGHSAHPGASTDHADGRRGAAQRC